MIKGVVKLNAAVIECPPLLAYVTVQVVRPFVLLSGPSRGYVRRRLEAAGIPHAHTNAASYRDIPALYHALDLYIVASRQEGGPKAISQTKELLRQFSKQALSVEEVARAIAAPRLTDECKHGLAAFFAKQPPPWKSQP